MILTIGGNMIRKGHLIAILALATIVSAFVIPTGTPSEIGLISGTEEHPVFEYSGTELSAEIIETESGNFIRLDFEGANVAGEIGAPQLPVVRRLVQIPFGAEPRIYITHIETETYPLADFGVFSPIYPMQAPVPKIRDYRAEFDFDNSVYEANRRVFGSHIEIVDVQTARNYRLALVEVRPVDYNPATGEIHVVQSLEYAIEFPGADMAETRRIKERYYSRAYDASIRPLIENPNAWDARWVPNADALGFLIITGSTYGSYISELVQWKSRKGYSVKTRTATSLGGTTTGIRNWILAEYDTAAIAPTFVLLVGDVAHVPRYTGSASSSATDTPYGNMDATGYIPELYVGRISPASNSQLEHFVQRIVNYERFNIPAGYQDFADKACFLASNDASYWSVAEATHRYAVQTHFGPAGFACDTIKARSNPNHRIATINAINDGRMIVNYSGHGGYYSWEAPEMSATDVQNLTNINEYPFVISNACITGTYSLTECFGETWIRQTNKGAIAFLGASNNSYWNEDDVMERRMYDDTFWDEYYFTAGMMNRGLYAVYTTYPSNANYYYDIYNLLGDPSVPLWFRLPAALSATHPANVGVGANVTVNVTSSGSPVNGALVCVTNDGNVHSVGYTNSSGNITLSTTGSIVGDTLWVTATKYNKIPYEGFIVVGGSGPWLSLFSSTTDDPAGDNDNIVDIGENINITAALRNTGTATANSVTGKLRSGNPHVTIIDSVKSYGNIAVGANVSNSTPFICRFGAGIPDGESVQMIIFAKDALDSSWTLSFNVEVSAPVTSYFSHSVDDPAGDGDGYAEPGESIELDIDIQNTGGETARFMMLTLSTSDPYITITSANSGIDSIAPSGVKKCATPFLLNVSPSCPTPYSASMIITVVDYRGPTSVDTFAITIGQAGFVDDCESGPGGWNSVSLWGLSTRRTGSPYNSWYSGSNATFMYQDNVNAVLETPEIITPDNPVLTFWHYYFTEPSYDSCLVTYTTNGGASWQRLGGYEGPSGDWKFAYFDLSSRAVTPGAPIKLRFTQTADTYVHGEGWFIDDIALERARNAYVGAGQVEPFAGNTGTQFTFRVRIASPSSHSPSNVRVFIDDTPYTMSYSGTGDLTSDGALYEYSTYLPVASHSYHFEFVAASASYRYPAVGEIEGPFVSAPFYEFDIGNMASGLSAIGPRDDWQYGVPTSGPSSVPIGTKCWATRISANYSDSSQSRLALPPIDLTGIEAPFLCYYHWYRFQSSTTRSFHDGGNIKISTDGNPANAFIVHPQFGYDGTASQYSLYTKWETVYGGNDLGNFWQFEAIDLSPWSGQTINVYFDFGSSSVNNEAGWYVNNIYILGAETVGDIGDAVPTKPEEISIRAHPNPFNSVVEFRIENPNGERAKLQIFDISGRMVGDLSEEANVGDRVRWNAEGRAGGIYFVRLTIGETAVTAPVVYVK